MTTRSRRVVLCTAAVVLLVSASCSTTPTSPTSESPSRVSRVGLELVAPSEIAPGETVQLTANAVNSDGSVENVTSQAQWTSESMTAKPALALTATGVATGGASGRARVTASFGGFAAGATIFVLPRGTFRLAGTVTWCGVGLADVTVRVATGIGTGLTAQTDVSGTYELYGVAGLLDIRASKEGFPDRILDVDVTAHQILTFPLKDNPAGIGCWDY